MLMLIKNFHLLNEISDFTSDYRKFGNHNKFFFSTNQYYKIVKFLFETSTEFLKVS